MDNSKYLSVYPMESAAKKISDMLDEILEKQPRIYEKTRVRYKDLAVSMLSSVEKIAKIAQLDALSPHSTDEFDELSSVGFDSSIDLALKHAQKEVETAKSFTSSKNDDSYIDLDKIDEVFLEVSQIEFGWDEVNQCARLLYMWFHTRFIEKPVQTCNYKYLGGWVTKFIIQFGNHCSKQSCNNFESSLYDWCKRLDITHSVYAQPFFIYNALESVDPADFTLEAVLVNDLLYSKGLYKLSELYKMFDSLEVCRIVKNKNPSLTPRINMRFAKQQELLKSVSFNNSGREVD